MKTKKEIDPIKNACFTENELRELKGILLDFIKKEYYKDGSPRGRYLSLADNDHSAILNKLNNAIDSISHKEYLSATEVAKLYGEILCYEINMSISTNVKCEKVVDADFIKRVESGEYFNVYKPL